MKFLEKRLLLFVVATFLIVFAVACGPAQPPEEVSEPTTEEEVEAPTVPADDSTGEEGVFDAELPPVEPISIEGAETTDSGLQFLEKVAGDGEKPKDGDLVTIHVMGTLSDGTVIIDTYSQGTPASSVFGQDQMPSGLEEGVGMLAVGGQAQLLLTSEQANEFGPLPPDSQLILDVELLSAEQPPQPTAVDDGDLTETDSGLAYVDLTEGDGQEVEEGNNVTTEFVLWVQDDAGDIFIVSSEDRDPVSFTAGSTDIVFQGWSEGTIGMKEGGRRLLVIPPELGLGDQGGSGIPPGSTLVMEIEVNEVIEAPKMTEVDEADYEETDSGLKYFDIVEGDGPSPEEGQTVTVNYSGWLEDGTMFDSSITRGQPFSFPIGLGSVIQGWDEGVATMKVGGTRQLVIPSDLAYGDGGSGLIPPGATLIFDVELLDITE